MKVEMDFKSALLLYLLSIGISAYKISATYDSSIDEQDNNENILDLSNTGTTRLNGYSSNSISENAIDLSYNNITNIDSSTFDDLQNLVYVDLTGNSISRRLIDLKLPNLETLVLDRALAKLSDDDINRYNFEYRPYLPSLQKAMDEGYDLFERMGVDKFYSPWYKDLVFWSSMQNLRRIYLRGNNIPAVYGLIQRNFPILSQVYLSENNISSIEFINFLPPSLTLLDLSNNSIEEIKDGRRTKLSDVNLKNLLHLDLSYNKIKYIVDHAFDNLTGLTTLRLDYNQLESIPDIRLDNLRNFSVAHNRIRQISQPIFGPQLRSLDLSNNYITNILPKTFDHLSSLEELNLARNELKFVPGNFISKCRIKVLFLDRDLFQNLTNLSLEGAVSAKIMSVGDNSFQFINFEQFFNGEIDFDSFE